MKKLILLSFLLLAFACDTPTKKKEKEIIVIPEPKEVVVEKKVEKIDNTLITLKKEPCSGDCPVFKVTINKDSTLTYTGIEYTKVLGEHTIKLNPKEYSAIAKAIGNAEFHSFNKEYSDASSNDFSKTTITFDSKEVSVRLWKDAPKELTKVYVAIEDILYHHKLLE